MSLTADQIFKLNNRMGKVASDVQLGTKLNQALSGQLAADSISLAELAPGVKPSHVVKFAGRFTTLGGDAAESIPVVGVLATDEVHVSVRVAGATPRSVVASVTAADAINVTMSGDPSTDHVLTYSVLRAAV